MLQFNRFVAAFVLAGSISTSSATATIANTVKSCYTDTAGTKVCTYWVNGKLKASSIEGGNRRPRVIPVKAKGSDKVTDRKQSGPISDRDRVFIPCRENTCPEPSGTGGTGTRAK